MAKKRTGRRLSATLHRWPGLAAAVVLFWFALSGIVLNHRGFFARVDLPRAAVPASYGYGTWGNNALRGNIVVSPDSMLVYGDIGVWTADSSFSSCNPLNDGFPAGADNRKVSDLHRDAGGRIYAATLFGLYGFDEAGRAWRRLPAGTGTERFVAIESVGDTVFAMSRSRIFRGIGAGTGTAFRQIDLAEPVDFDDGISLFRTLMDLHSGSVLGLAGRLFVDCIGLAVIAVSLTGVVVFIFPGWIRGRRRRRLPVTGQVRATRWALALHGRVGAWFFCLLAISFLTGMFLRPPFLALVAGIETRPIGIDSPGRSDPWRDRLRDLRYDASRRCFFLSTSRGMYRWRGDGAVPERCDPQPPVSVMGITAFEPAGDGTFLVGSFSGLFRWRPGSPEIVDVLTGEAHRGAARGRPVGDAAVTGLVSDAAGRRWMVDYSRGPVPLAAQVAAFPGPPENLVRRSRISLWNLSLEVHTGRILEPFVGAWYILVVPLAGLIGLVVAVSGYAMWYVRRRSASRRAPRR